MACVGGGLGWASSAFPANDSKLRSGSKLQSLGKHKLSVSNTIRPKSKLKKVSMEHSDVHNLLAEQVFQPVATIAPNNLNLRYDLTSVTNNGIWADGVDSDFSPSMDKALSLEVDGFDVVPHNYIPDLISGLDDCSMMPDYTDIG